ncbi:multidrug ABC transporter ATPase [Microbacterium sp. NC79]|uniref:multidrug ABC transporter ATPase n=1 Tax=Microbacterium sp. NC79 TaxID=2851009 RepID=UPI001C2BBAD7|nr:multidrug ABC transporter ATPase [Microbacterium sp. NC79]MBV0895445.1 multidrug ABC transporter ATPase [Microbacterium sp. NC79]
MSNENPDTEVPVTRLDRILAVSSLTLIVAAVICFVAVIIGSMITVDFSTPLWTILSGIMYYGLPLGVVLFFTLLISNTVRRAKLAKAARGNQQR